MRKVTGLWMAVCLALLVLGLRWHPLWGAALAVGGCAGISRFLSARAGRRARRFAGRPDGAELAAVMEAADRELKQLRLYADRIADRRTRDAAAALADIGGRVYDELCRRPERIPSAGRLLAARLDAAGQLLIRYAAYQEAGLRTPEVLEFQRRVRGTLPGQRADLERQLARLRSSPETGSGEADQETGERLPEPEAGACGTGIRSCCQ